MLFLIARVYLAALAHNRKLLVFIDNDPARDSLIRGYSDSTASLALIYQYYDQERQWPSYPWFSRVPSYSNPADAPSRGDVLQASTLYKATIVQAGVPDKVLASLLGFEHSTGM